VCFECEYYTAIRRPLQAAATAWCQEAGTPPSKSGLAGAIHWAATDRMTQGAIRAANPAAGDTLRDSAVSFYAKAMAIRHPLQQVQHQLSDEQGRCLATSHRRWDLGTNRGVTEAMPIEKKTHPTAELSATSPSVAHCRHFLCYSCAQLELAIVAACPSSRPSLSCRIRTVLQDDYKSCCCRLLALPGTQWPAHNAAFRSITSSICLG
jgi:hypothetical protein